MKLKKNLKSKKSLRLNKTSKPKKVSRPRKSFFIKKTLILFKKILRLNKTSKPKKVSRPRKSFFIKKTLILFKKILRLNKTSKPKKVSRPRKSLFNKKTLILFKKSLFNKKTLILFKKILIKFLAIILLVFIIAILFRFQSQLIFFDNYLTLGFGWIRILIYLIVMNFCLIFIFNLTTINYKMILISLITILIINYFVGSIFEIINNKFFLWWKNDSSYSIFQLRINDYLFSYQKYLNTENKLNFFYVPWLNCQAGLVGINITWVTNYIDGLFTIICSSIFFIFLLCYFIFKKPFIIIQATNKFIFDLISMFTLYHFVASKFSKFFFIVNYYYLQRKRKFIGLFKKNHYNFQKNDKNILYFFKKHRKVHYHEIFNNHTFYRKRWNWNNNKKSNFQGIYAFYVDNFYGKEKIFLPCYVGKSNDIITRWKSHYKKIKYAYENPGNLVESLAVYQRVAAYLHAYKLTPDDLRFIVLEWVVSPSKLPKAEAYWINKIKTTQRGWNSIRA